MKIIVGTRGSNLALTQTNLVIKELKEKNPDLHFEIKIIKTKGDIVLDVPLHKLNANGIFSKEIEQALLNKEIDLAVHSMKDMPSKHTKGLIFGAIPKGEDPRDAVVSNKTINKLSDLEGCVIGTGSIRRDFQLRNLIKNIEVKGIRGNIESRMNKIETENLDGVILAASGLKRANYENRISYYFDPKIFIPSPCQGILALQIREDDEEINSILKTIEHFETTIKAKAERAFLRTLGVGCEFPMGAYSEINGESLTLHVLYGEESGKFMLNSKGTAHISEAENLGIKLAKELINKSLCLK
ncbi:MAG: porphobilinogen deaminase [Bacillota bacterium]|nr:porphobilinogen deaminase [Bacillota bacterium]